MDRRAKLSDSDRAEIRAAKGQRTQPELAAQYGVNVTTIHRVQNGRKPDKPRPEYSAQWKAEHPEQYKASRDAWYARNQERLAARKRFAKYGVLPSEFEAMSEHQAGLCGVCCEPLPRGKHCHIDHDHESGEIRGLLCHHCNIGVGMFKDDAVRLASAAAYCGAIS